MMAYFHRLIGQCHSKEKKKFPILSIKSWYGVLGEVVYISLSYFSSSIWFRGLQHLLRIRCSWRLFQLWDVYPTFSSLKFAHRVVSEEDLMQSLLRRSEAVFFRSSVHLLSHVRLCEFSVISKSEEWEKIENVNLESFNQIFKEIGKTQDLVKFTCI